MNRRACAGPTRIFGHKDRIVQVDGKAVSLLDIIAGMIDPKAKTVLDGFAGTQSVSHRLKRAGFGVTANDWRKASYYCGLALVSNNGTVLGDDDATRLTSGDRVHGPVAELLGNALGEQNALEFDRIVGNARRLAADGEVTKAVVAFYGLIHVLMAEMNVYHLHQSASGTLLGNGHIAGRDLSKAWRKWVLCEHPKCVFESDMACASHNADTVDLIRSMIVDCAYFDTPYPGSSSHFRDLRLLEDLCQIYETGELRPEYRREEPPHRFEGRSSYLASLTHLLLGAEHVPQWIVSLNTSSDVRPEEVGIIVRAMGRSCTIHRFQVPLPAGIPGLDNRGNCECLLDCRPDAALQQRIGEIKQELEHLTAGISMEEGI